MLVDPPLTRRVTWPWLFLFLGLSFLSEQVGMHEPFDFMSCKVCGSDHWPRGDRFLWFSFLGQMQTYCYKKKIRIATNKLTKFDLSELPHGLCGVWRRALWDKPCPGKEWEENQSTWSSLLHFLLNLLENRNGFPFRDEDKRKFPISRAEKWKFNVNIVIGEQSVFPMSFGLCPF